MVADDLIMEEDPDMQEALKRLPQDVIDERNFRIKRALQLSMQHRILPEHMHTTDETDIHYVKEVLAQVVREREEREKYDAL